MKKGTEGDRRGQKGTEGGRRGKKESEDMAEEMRFDVATREVSGSANARRLRRDGVLPGIVSTEKGKSRQVQLDRHGFELMLHRHASENLILDLSVDGGKTKKVLLKEVQHDPLTEEILHVDFVEISMTKKMRARIPVSLVGEPAGVEQDGGILEFLLREIEVECLPGDLVEQIEVDVSELKIGDSIQVEQVTVDPKLTVLSGSDIAVASVSPPRIEEEPTPEEDAEAAVAAEGAEPEVIGEKKEEGEEEEKEKGKEKGKEKEEGQADGK